MIRKSLPVLITTLCLGLGAPALAEVKASYLYNLSNFDGTIPYNGPKVSVDSHQHETFVLTGKGITIFDRSGMEIFQIESDPEQGNVQDVVADKEGNLYLLVHRDSQMVIVRCDYRGNPTGTLQLKNIPEKYSGSYTRMRYCNEQLYLVDARGLKVAVVDLAGSFVRGVSIAEMMAFSEKEQDDSDLGGFNVDPQGNILFTFPVLARAYKIGTDGKVYSLGKRGSGPGKFGVPSGIAGDGEGNILVTDRLRCMVLVFDRNLRFVREFGGRGLRKGNLIVPGEIAVDSDNKVYVSQLRNRGVNVYQLAY